MTKPPIPSERSKNHLPSKAAQKNSPGWGCSCGVLSLADVIATFTNIPAERSFLSSSRRRAQTGSGVSLGTPGYSASFLRDVFSTALDQGEEPEAGMSF